MTLSDGVVHLRGPLLYVLTTDSTLTVDKASAVPLKVGVLSLVAEPLAGLETRGDAF